MQGTGLRCGPGTFVDGTWWPGLGWVLHMLWPGRFMWPLAGRAGVEILQYHHSGHVGASFEESFANSLE